MNDWLETTVAEGAGDRVRGGVMTRIRRRRHARRVVGVVSLLAALAFVFWPVPAPMETLTLLAPKPPAAPVWVPVPQPVKPNTILAQAASRPAERITIYTDDPDVVIVLVADGGDE